jgi:hypothetical protein
VPTNFEGELVEDEEWDPLQHTSRVPAIFLDSLDLLSFYYNNM